MRTIYFGALGLLCSPQLSCSDEGCPDHHVRVDGACVVYTGNGQASGGQTSGGGSTSPGAGGSSAIAGAQAGGKGGTGPAMSQGGSGTGGKSSGGDRGETGGSAGTNQADAGASAGGAAEADAAFGALCTTSADCGGETDYCATPPTEPFYCTASGCDQTPSLCPTGYECLDLGLFVPGEPFVCVKTPEVGNGAFGDVCETNADCTGETNYCAFSPSEPPYCSVSGCDTAPELCPAGWSCFDVGQFVPGEPFVCVKP